MPDSVSTKMRRTKTTGTCCNVRKTLRAKEAAPSRQLLELLPEVCSLDAPTGENEEGTLQMLLEDIHAPQPQEELVRRELKMMLDSLMDTLTDRQKQVLRLRFGMEDGNCYSLEKVGDLLGISRERARQIERQALNKLHKNGTPLGLEDFLQ